jgi:hypothetical protein
MSRVLDTTQGRLGLDQMVAAGLSADRPRVGRPGKPAEALICRNIAATVDHGGRPTRPSAAATPSWLGQSDRGQKALSCLNWSHLAERAVSPVD